MRVMWITNVPIGDAARKIKNTVKSGTWMDAVLCAIQKEDIDLSIATVADIKELETWKENNIAYYCLPRKGDSYDYNDENTVELWNAVVKQSNPEIIMVWGTEYNYGLSAIKAGKGIPVVIMIQGIAYEIARNCYGGLSMFEMITSSTIHDILRKTTYFARKKILLKKASFEKEMFNASNNLIVDNEWAKNSCRSIAPGAVLFTHRLNVKDLFFKYKWNYDSCQKYSITCTDPGEFPIKGFHMMLKALYEVKKEFPAVVLNVPGMVDPFIKDKKILTRNSYHHYIVRMIRKLGLRDNIKFLGRMPSDRIATLILQSNVFVAPSAIENHSVSLREGMALGAPVICSFAGGMPEIIENGKNGFVYRYEEYNQLAAYIMSVFADPKMAETIGANASRKMIEFYSEKSDASNLMSIYSSIIQSNKKNG